MESSIPCSHGGRALVKKGAEEVENAKVNAKYQDKAEGQRPRNFIRPKFNDSGKGITVANSTQGVQTLLVLQNEQRAGEC
ncbi:hypothetical protein BHE74_00037250 [Ensete ventricosum]|nr:hypothetical protein BHE74_00037250 [Ensete ventricosum]RZS03525.1 hypothetical protein BHM03_00033703 [Ensete ventricosum]